MLPAARSRAQAQLPRQPTLWPMKPTFKAAGAAPEDRTHPHKQEHWEPSTSCGSTHYKITHSARCSTCHKEVPQCLSTRPLLLADSKERVSCVKHAARDAVLRRGMCVQAPRQLQLQQPAGQRDDTYPPAPAIVVASQPARWGRGCPRILKGRGHTLQAAFAALSALKPAAAAAVADTTSVFVCVANHSTPLPSRSGAT